MVFLFLKYGKYTILFAFLFLLTYKGYGGITITKSQIRCRNARKTCHTHVRFLFRQFKNNRTGLV